MLKGIGTYAQERLANLDTRYDAEKAGRPFSTASDYPEAPEQVAERVRKILAHIEPERVTLTTDCGLKQLPRVVAYQKLRALAEGAAIARKALR